METFSLTWVARLFPENRRMNKNPFRLRDSLGSDRPFGPFLEKPFIIAVLQDNTHLSACRLKDLHHTLNHPDFALLSYDRNPSVRTLVLLHVASSEPNAMLRTTGINRTQIFQLEQYSSTDYRFSFGLRKILPVADTARAFPLETRRSGGV